MADIYIRQTRSRAMIKPLSNKGRKWFEVEMGMVGVDINYSIDVEHVKDMVSSLEAAGLEVDW